MAEQAPRIDLSQGGGRLVYDKARRTIVSIPKESDMTTMTFVRGDDWEGIYINGKLISEGHSIDSRDAATLAVTHKATSVETKHADLDWLHDEGNLPQSLADVKLEA